MTRIDIIFRMVLYLIIASIFCAITIGTYYYIMGGSEIDSTPASESYTLKEWYLQEIPKLAIIYLIPLSILIIPLTYNQLPEENKES